MSQEFDALSTQVTANDDVEASAVTLIQGIAAQLASLAASNPTPAAINALASSLNASATSLSAAVAANTAPPTPTPAGA